MKKNLILVFSVFAAAVAAAADPAELKQPPPFTYGGDIRLRNTYFDNIPYSTGAEARGGVNHFQRYRFRFWADYQATENIRLYGRLLNEFFTYTKTANRAWRGPDEFVFDNLFLDLTGGDWALRIGRQDLIYGTGKVILDGTPKDGSRTIYFDAAKLTYKGFEKTEVDFLLLHTQAKDPLAMRSRDRDIVGFAGGNAYEGSETGGGIYLKNSRFANLPFEAYYLVKVREQPNTAAVPVTNKRHTPGVRLMPKFSETMDGNLELAGQFGNDIFAYMMDASLNWHAPALSDVNGCVSLGWYHLSGNNPSTARDEGWNPLWARWPQYSELYVYAYDMNGAGRWSNVSMPHIDFSFNPVQKVRTSLLAGYMFAPERDGAGGGQRRGFLATLWNRFTLGEQMFTSRDKLTGHVLLEMLEPGSYYTSGQQRTAVFGRVELVYSF